MDKISETLYKALAKSCDSCSSNLISLSGGLDSSIIAHLLRQKRPQGLTVIAEDFIATDLTYCQMISKEMQMPLSILNASTPIILEAVEETVKILKNFNDIEIRNNVVIYLAIKWAKENGIKSMVTGDGADELFAGYSFLINKSQDNLKEEIDRVCTVMHFPAQKIGRSFGVRIESPFLNEEVIKLAKKIPSDLKVREDENGKRHGKWILRKTFEEYIPRQIAWREKSPMQDGAGTVGLTKLFDSVIDKEKFAEKKILVKDTDGIIIRSRESMHYYEIFKRLFGAPSTDKHAKKICPYCRYDIKSSKFCRMCGSFPV